MDKRTYLALFDPEEMGNGYTVTFPDLPGAITEGNDLAQARRVARECLELHLWGMERDGDEIPEASQPELMQVPPGAFLAPIDAWMDLMRDDMENKAVNKMVTLPRWLKDAAERENINFSQLLQHALKERLGVAQTLERESE